MTAHTNLGKVPYGLCPDKVAQAVDVERDGQDRYWQQGCERLVAEQR